MARHRAKLDSSRETLLQELERLDQAIAELREREILLDRLAATGGQERDSGDAANHDRDWQNEELAAGAQEMDDPMVLRGPEIRRVAVRVLLDLPDAPEALHYRDWLEHLEQRGYVVAGKDSPAVFLSQVSRSPVVRKTTQPGVYALDRDAPSRLRHNLARLHAQLSRWAAVPPDDDGRDYAREQRNAVNLRISQEERALAEADDLLSSDRRAQPRGATAA